MIVLADFGFGNLRAVENLFWAVGEKAVISDDPILIRSADHLVLSGVGAFDSAVTKIFAKEDLFAELSAAVLSRRIPLLGICVGMQVLFERSEEGRLGGLSWLEGEIVGISTRCDFPVPHMGWNTVRAVKGSRLLVDGLAEFYFCHSFGLSSESAQHVSGVVEYGNDWAAVVETENIFGVQFHPEKSLSSGRELLLKFAGL